MDPLNPIVPAQRLIGPIPRLPGVPRVSPEQQRRQTPDDQPEERESDDEAAFEDLLDEAATPPRAIDEQALDDFFIPEVTRTGVDPVAEPPAQDRRTAASEADDSDEDGPESHHIDIIA